MAPQPPPSFPLPQVHVAFEPYVNPLSTALEKRRVLEVLVRDICRDLDGAKTVPSRDEFEKVLDEKLGRVRTRDRSKGVRAKFGFKGKEEKVDDNKPFVMECPRREYLRAYRDRVEARRAWEEASKDEEQASESDGDDDDEDKEEVEAEEKEFSTLYGHTVSLRTTLQSLILLRDYLVTFSDLLEQIPPELPTITKLAFPPLPVSATVSTAPDSVIHTTSKRDALLVPLQNRIYTLAKEISELQKNMPSMPAPGSGDKARALDATRTELISWIEDHLPNGFDSEEPDRDDPRNPNSSAPTREESLKRLEDAYARYCRERETLCGIQKSLANVPATPDLSTLSFTDPHQNRERPSTPTHRRPSVAPMLPMEQVYPHLHALTAVLPALVSRHKALLQNKAAVEVSLSDYASEVKSAVPRGSNAAAAASSAMFAADRDKDGDAVLLAAKAWTGELGGKREEAKGAVREIVNMSEEWVKAGGDAYRRSVEVVGEGEGGWEKIDGGVGVLGSGI